MATQPQRGPGPSPGELSTGILGLGSLTVLTGKFLVYLLIFIAILWGSLARGAFYSSGLVIFGVLAAGAAAAAIGWRRGKLPLRWWVTSALPVIAAILASAAARNELWGAGYALAPVGAAAGLGLAGCVARRLPDRLLMLRLVVDVALLTAVLCWLGVAWHISSLAQPLSDGWRAGGPIGYSNVTGLVLLLGLLCGSAVAAVSGRAADDVRCLLLAAGMLATQSRSVVLGVLVCVAVLWFISPPVARVLGRNSLWALVAFTGLLPSIRGLGYGGFVATLTLVATVCLVLRRPEMPSPGRRTRAWLMVLAAAAAGLVAVTLRGRILDGGSDDGRIQLWLTALRQLHWTGFFGAGPAQAAELSRGELVTLLTHNDLLQYAQYYGVPGVAALLLIGVRAAVLLARRRAAVPPEMWGTGVSALIAVVCVMAVDFPLQVPLIPALTCLIIGAVAGAPDAGPPVPAPAREPAGAAGSTQAADSGALDPVISAQ